MFRSARPWLLSAFALAASSAAHGQETRTGFFIAPQVSTLGLGVEAGYRATDYFGVRTNANFFGLSRGTTIDSLRYDADLRLQSFGILADLHPFAGSFRLTGGLRINNNRGDLSATPAGNVTIGNTSYSPADIGRLDGRVEFNTVAPYAGLGWGTTLFSPNLYLGADIGVMFQGSPKVFLASSGGLATQQFQSDLERERQSIQDKAKDYRFYPVISISIGYRF